jgi:hypothetical protein
MDSDLLDSDNVKTGPCECPAHMEQCRLIHSTTQCPDGVSAQYVCDNCDTQFELQVADEDGFGRELTCEMGWTDV